MDTNEFYLQHYFDFTNAGKFLLFVILGLALVLFIILEASRLQKKETEERFGLVERFYEMCFSSTSVLFFLSLYNFIDWHMPEVSDIWQKYQDVILLIFILLSVFLTSLFDLVLVRLTHIKTSEKADVRLTSSFYIILILLYIRFIYQDTNYNQMILYFVTLAAGRFFYFDFTVKDFKKMVRGVGRNLPMLLLMVVYSALVCWYGFYSGFLLTSNGVIISVFIAHLFMDLAIFVIDKTRIVKLILKVRDKKGDKHEQR